MAKREEQIIPILFEDEDILVVSKPPGLVVNKADTVKEKTLQDWFEERQSGGALVATSAWQKLVPADFLYEYGSPEEVFAQRGGVVHRLDKETSGVMVMAKNPGALANLLRQFRVRETRKMYTCLVHGKFQILEDVVSLPLGRSLENRTKFAVTAEGREAETEYKVRQFYPNFQSQKILKVVKIRAAELNELKTTGPSEIDPAQLSADLKNLKNLKKKVERNYQGFSLVSCWPKTGRTHQIRVHMAHLRHPIVSDVTYLGKKRHSLDQYWCPRLFLHATELTLAHPRTGKQLKFTAPLWPDLETALGFVVEPSAILQT